MKLKDLIKGVKVKEISADINTDIKGVCYHSGYCRDGFAYFVREGLNYNGYDFVPDCYKKGVSVFIGEKGYSNFPFVVVDDIREAQAIISSNFYGNPQNSIKVIGITGTNGKTTTAYLLKKALNGGLISTVDIYTGKRREKARLTTPESTDVFKYLREMVDSGFKYAVLEVSAHALSLKRIHGIKFDAVVFTTFSQDHLDYYKTMDNYLKAKTEIFNMLKDNGFCVLNSDLNITKMREFKCNRKILVGKSKHSDIEIVSIKEKDDGIFVVFRVFGEGKGVYLPLIGDYNAHNLGFTIGVMEGLDLDYSRFLKDVEKGFSVPGRVERIKSNKGFSVIVDFAHTPEGLENLLSSVRKHTSGRLITVFGCGGERDRSKRPLMLEAVCKFSDTVFVTADNPRRESIEQIFDDIKKGNSFNKKVYYIKDRRDAIMHAVDSANKGDCIVLAGKGHEEYQIIGDRKIPFSDRQVVLEALGYEGK